MVKSFYRRLRIERPGSIKIADHFFFFVSILTIGFPRRVEPFFRSALLGNWASR
jgi:hypothetical protein